MTPHNLPLLLFARLVRRLRAIQKRAGAGYRTPADSVEAMALGKQVDDQIDSILGPRRADDETS